MFEEKHSKGKFEQLKKSIPSNLFYKLYYGDFQDTLLIEKENFEAKNKAFGIYPLTKEEIKKCVDDWRKLFEKYPAKFESDNPIYSTILNGIGAMKNKEQILKMVEARIYEEILSFDYQLQRWGKIAPSGYK